MSKANRDEEEKRERQPRRTWPDRHCVGGVRVRQVLRNGLGRDERGACLGLARRGRTSRRPDLCHCIIRGWCSPSVVLALQ